MPTRNHTPRSRRAPRAIPRLSFILLPSSFILPSPSLADLTFTLGGSWDTDARRNVAIASLQSAVNRYNAYGDFGNYNVYAYYNAGIPTAQASYLGSIGYGGTWPNERVTLHEMSHYLGTGTYGTPWDGPRAEAIVDQFDGIEASLNGDGAHYWPYGLNYDSEGSPVNFQRHVALLYAMRADMGIGSTANPTAWAATTVHLTASDALNESGFNFASKWSDNTFAHPSADYHTGDFLLRTPASPNSFTFAGKSVTVNNTNGTGGGLLYKGTGSAATLTFNDLRLSGGYVRHASGAGDVFRLAGKITLTGAPTIDAAQGAIVVSASVGGPGSLTKTGPYPLILTGGATYAGDTHITAGTLRLAAVSPVASYTFDAVSGPTVTNSGTGGAAMNGTLTSRALITPNGRFGSAVAISAGGSVDINHPITDLGPTANWTVSAWVKTSTPGATLLSKSNGGWASGNTIFYLGDGSAGGAGGVPSAVRWGGGFFQGAPAATPVNDNTWHLVTYVNNAGAYALYVDGVPQPLSPGNAGLSNADVGSLVRLGLTTNTFAGDGTVNLAGLLDDVQFFSQALSPAQVASLYQGAPVGGSLPTGTTVHIASGATLDVNGTVQQIAALNGPAGASVLLGSGQLIVSSAAHSTFAGTLSGTGGSLVKAGPGTLTLSGAASYTGPTTVAGGTLSLAPAASTPVLNSAGADVRDDATLLFTYAGSASPLETVAARIASGAITSSNATARHTLGYLDTGSAVTVLLTLAGDANLNGTIDPDDFALLDRGLLTGGTHWFQGDFNHDRQITAADYLLLDTTHALQQGGTLSPTFLAQRHSRFGPTYVSDLLISIPEPASLLLSALYCLLSPPLTRRRRPTHA